MVNQHFLKDILANGKLKNDNQEEKRGKNFKRKKEKGDERKRKNANAE